MFKKFVGILFVVGIGVAIWLAMQIKTPVIGKSAEIRIRSNWTLDSLADQLVLKAGLEDKESFKLWVERMRYTHASPGFIKVNKGDDIWKVVKNLKSNRYQTRNVVINPEYDLEKTAKSVSNKIEVGQEEFMAAMKNDQLLSQYGVDQYNWQALFVPNSYEFYVKSDLAKFLEKMKGEHDKFWNEERLSKAKSQGFTKLEVVNIASIATKESRKLDELENIAGVYINRLRIGMALGADPTINFAKGKSGRVLYEDINIDSKYNTYKNVGLPPGPICIPHPKAIDAVLNYKKHDYLYFCAKEDFSGYHVFAKNFAEHDRNANRWRKALKKLNRENRAREASENK